MAPPPRMEHRHPRVKDRHYENPSGVRLTFRADGRVPLQDDPHRRALVKSYVEDAVRWIIRLTIVLVMVGGPWWAFGKEGGLVGVAACAYIYSKMPEDADV